MADETQTDSYQADEMEAVLSHREREALAAGMSEVDAWDFARSETDIGHLRHLIKQGCPPKLLSRIL
jgi:hypothetical protein